MSELTKQALKVENNQSFPNNNAGLITPTNLRTFNENMIDSNVNQATYTADSASFNSRINAITGSGGSVATGSLLTTASFDNNTRNLTFTKGDSSTFAVNIPDASGSVLPSGVVSGSSQLTSSYDLRYALSGSGGGATLGSNTFIGNQTITGSLAISSSTSCSVIVPNGFNDEGFLIDGNLRVTNGNLRVDQSIITAGIYTQTLARNSNDPINVDNSLNIRPNAPGVNATNISVSGSINASGSISYSLAQGNVLVGDVNGRTQAIPTSSFGGGGTGNGFPFSGSAVITGSLSVSETIKSQVYINPQTIDGFTIPTGNNAMLVGPVAVSGSIVLEGNSNLVVLSQVTSSSTPLPSGVVSGSSQLTSSYDLRYALSGSGGGTIPTGSFATTGSNTFIGNQTITGSLFLSSSDAIHILVPNFPGAPAPGGVSITGSVAVNGNFALDGGNFFAGQLNTGKIVASDGLLDIVSNVLIYNDSNINNARTLGVSGSVHVSQSLYTGDLYVGGNKQFNVAEFFSTTTQSGSAGVSGSITFNNSGSVNGVSLANNTQITVANAGTYNIQFSAQVETNAGSDSAYIWFKKNGTNISTSATKLVLANNTAQVMTVNILDEANANDYYELAYQTNNGHATLLAEVASGNIPAIPSVIATVTQVR